MLNQYGISDEEIIDDFGDLNSPELIYVGLYLANKDVQNANFTENEVVDCLLRATGIQAIDAFWSSFTNKIMLVAI